MAIVNVSTARQTLPAQLDRVEAGEEVAITRHGRVVALLVRPDRVRQARAAEAWRRADAIGARLERARREPITRVSGPPGWADDLVADVRAERDER